MVTVRVEMDAGPEHWTHDPKNWPYYEIELPAGYRRVFSGALRPGDCFLDLEKLNNQGKIQWVPVDAWSNASDYNCVIRREPPESSPEHVCERCELLGAPVGERFCDACARIIVREFRRR